MKSSSDDYLYFQKDCLANDILIADNPTVGIHGIIGSFTDEALQRLTDHCAIDAKQLRKKELVHAKSVIESVIDGKIDVGIFAVANSGSGAYLASIEAMAAYKFRVIAVFTMKIQMCILSHPEIKTLEKINEFRGHPVAIAQCRRTIEKKWPDVPVKPDTDEMDTALSAQLLSEGKIAKTSAVFASKRAAELYGLTVLVDGAHDDPMNATSFIVIKK